MSSRTSEPDRYDRYGIGCGCALSRALARVELRFGHARIWSTAQARFGRPLKVTGIKHPAPVLLCKVVRTKGGVEVAAPFATPILRGGTPADLRRSGPATELWFLLYARVLQADGASYRNVLLETQPADELRRQGDFFVPDTRDFIGQAVINIYEIYKLLEAIALPADSPLGVLAVELLPGGSRPITNTLDRQIGSHRILRTSPLTAVPAFC